VTGGAAPAQRPVHVRLRLPAETAPGLPALAMSVLGHVAVLGLVALVLEPEPFTRKSYLPVRLVSVSPRPPAKAPKAAPPAAPRPAPPQAQQPPRVPPPRPAARPVAPSRVKPAKPEPQPKPAETPPAPAVAPPSAAPAPALEPAPPAVVSEAGVSVRAEDESFADDQYLHRLVARVSSRWTKPRVGLPARSAVVYFELARAGQVSALRLEEGSGVSLFDRSALRAIELAAPLPPLPAAYRSPVLKVHFEFIP
jgi:TonB family protein